MHFLRIQQEIQKMFATRREREIVLNSCKGAKREITGQLSSIHVRPIFAAFANIYSKVTQYRGVGQFCMRLY